MASELIPDRPVAFGYKQVWLAVKDVAPMSLSLALGLSDLEDSTWEDGIKKAYGYDRDRRQYRAWQDIFVSPLTLGWTFAVGGIRALPSPPLPEWLPWIRGLSNSLGHVQSFGTHRVSSAVYWAKAEHGHVLRAYSYADGATHLNEGGPTPEEVALGFDFLDERRATPADVAAHEAKLEAEDARYEAMKQELRSLEEAHGEKFVESILDQERFASKIDLLIPGEDTVMMLAGRWSLDPMRVEEYGIGPGLGLIGKIRKR